MLKSAIFSLLFVIGCLILAWPAVAQPLELTTNNGCHVWVMLSGEIAFQPLGHAASLNLQNVSTGQVVTLDLECIDFPPEPEVEPAGIQQSVSICNWRMRENAVKGTTRAEVRWFPNLDLPARLTYSANSQIIRATRYSTGATSVRGEVDLTTDTITLDSFTLVLCRELDS